MENFVLQTESLFYFHLETFEEKLKCNDEGDAFSYILWKEHKSGKSGKLNNAKIWSEREGGGL